MADLMRGKRGLIMGVANERSIAWGIAKTMAEEGAELAFTYQGEAFGRRVEPLAASVGSDILVDADVTDGASLDAAFFDNRSEMGTSGFPGPRHRFFRQKRIDRPVYQYIARKFPEFFGYFLFFAD